MVISWWRDKWKDEKQTNGGNSPPKANPLKILPGGGGQANLVNKHNLPGISLMSPRLLLQLPRPWATRLLHFYTNYAKWISQMSFLKFIIPQMNNQFANNIMTHSDGPPSLSWSLYSPETVHCFIFFCSALPSVVPFIISSNHTADCDRISEKKKKSGGGEWYGWIEEPHFV